MREMPVDVSDAARQSLLDAAGAILAADGPERLTVRHIAARAGCSTMLVYSRFGGKHGVVDALWTDGFVRLRDYLEDAPLTADPIADLAAAAARYRDFAKDNPTSYSVMFDRAVPDFQPSPEAARVGSATLDVLAARVQRAIDAGRLRAGDARQLAAALWAANHGVVSLELKDSGPPDIDWPRCHDEVIRAVLHGLEAT